MQYKEVLGWLKAINGAASLCGDNLAILLTFNTVGCEPRVHNPVKSNSANNPVTATAIDGNGSTVCEVSADKITEALLGIASDIDPRDIYARRDNSHANALAMPVKPRAIAAMIKLKGEIQDDMRMAGQAGDYAKAAALRQKSIGITMAMRVAKAAK